MGVITVGVLSGDSLTTLVIVNLSFIFSRVLVVKKSAFILNVPVLIGNAILNGTPGVKIAEL